MASVSIDPEGGNPVYSGEGATGNNTKEANDAPQQIPVDGPQANTGGALPSPIKGGRGA